ncbi:hypothetical protein Ctob_005185, partial [Chrysochromulina tobinii]
MHGHFAATGSRADSHTASATLSCPSPLSNVLASLGLDEPGPALLPLPPPSVLQFCSPTEASNHQLPSLTALSSSIQSSLYQSDGSAARSLPLHLPGVFPLPGYIGGCGCSTSISSCAPRLAHILPSICDAAMPGAGSDEGSALAVHMEVPLATAGGVAPWPPASSAAPRLQLPLPLSVDQVLHVASGFP